MQSLQEGDFVEYFLKCVGKTAHRHEVGRLKVVCAWADCDSEKATRENCDVENLEKVKGAVGNDVIRAVQYHENIMVSIKSQNSLPLTKNIFGDCDVISASFQNRYKDVTRLT